MTNIIRPIAGSVSSYTSCGFTASAFNSLASGSVVVMPTTAAIDNTSNLDIWADVSFSLVVGAATTAASYLALYLLPLNQDGTTYGDGTTTGTALPAPSYWLTNAFAPVLASGGTLTGTFPTVWLPRKKFILGIGNLLGGALGSAAAAAVAYATTNMNGNG